MTKSRPNNAVIAWLLTGCVLIAIMVVIGGITRLTHSGLSITEWEPIMGAVPPTSDTEWEEAFDKYKQIPEYEAKHYWMELEDFKFIYFWEYIHRQWGRMMGVVFFIPFMYFVLKRKIRGRLLMQCVNIMLWGGAVGALGWFMVASGLSERTDVSHYRLAIHLVAAFGLCLYIFWVALSLIYPDKNRLKEKLKPYRKWVIALLIITFIQVIYGAFVAGLRAGFIHTTFPLMSGKLIPHDFMGLHGNTLDFVEHKTTVQFVHRVLAFVVFFVTLYLWNNLRRMNLSKSQHLAVHLVFIAICVQFLLGVLTIIYAVPLTLGVLHQLGALLLLGAIVYLLHRLTYGNSQPS